MDKITGAAILTGTGIALSILVLLNLVSIDGIVPNEVVQLVGKTVIDTSATLIAFWGIILIFHLRSLLTRKNGLIEKNIDYYFQIKQLMCKMKFEDNSRKDEIEQQIEEQKELFNKKWRVYKNEALKKIDENIRLIGFFGIIVVILFISAILSSICIMGVSLTNVHFSSEMVEFLGIEMGWLGLPLACLMLGLMCISVGIILVLPEKSANID